jgi:putative aldouronate transport system permease protein
VKARGKIANGDRLRREFLSSVKTIQEQQETIVSRKVTRRPQKGFLAYVLKHRNLYLMIVPGILLILIFNYIPIYGVIIAFKQYDIVSGFFSGEWVGFRYFIQFSNDPYFFRIIRNTILLNIYGFIFGFPAPIILALLLNEIRAKILKRVIQSISIFPSLISTVVIVGMMMKIFSNNGLVNNIMAAVGLPRQLFFSNPIWFRPLYVSSSIWQGMGYASVIYLATLSSINVELYESAIIDGANRWQQAIHITLPGIMPTVAILLILNIGSMMSVGFDKVYLMYNPAIYETSDVISTYVYRRGIGGADFSYATAVGLFNSIISFMLLFTANNIFRKTGDLSLW